MPPRIVFLSDHKAHAQRLALALAERRVALDAVLVTSGDLVPLQSGMGKWARSVAQKARRRVRFLRHHRPFYAPLSTRIQATGETNSPAMRRDLARLTPDYIIMGIGVILEPALIETARCGVLNVHPALLPWVRGGGVVGHALQSGMPLGATLHFIDAGIDTGAIIERRLLPITQTSHTLASLEAATNRLAAQLLAERVEELARTNEKPPGVVQTARFPLFRWPDAASRPVFNDLALAGRAWELFQSWKSVCEGEPWRLPPELSEAPAPLNIEPR